MIKNTAKKMMKNKKKIKKIIKDFKKNFSEDFVMEEAEIWLESEIEELIKGLIPPKISDEKTAEEIRNFPRRLDDEEKQKIRAKNYGWNLCVEKMINSLKDEK
jgi:hypothetical protein